MKNINCIFIAIILTLFVAFSPILIASYFENDHIVALNFPRFKSKVNFSLTLKPKNWISSGFELKHSKPLVDKNLNSTNLFDHLKTNAIVLNSSKLITTRKDPIYKSKLFNHECILNNQVFTIFKHTEWSLPESTAKLKSKLTAVKIPVLPDEPYATGSEDSVLSLILLPAIYCCYVLLKFFRN